MENVSLKFRIDLHSPHFILTIYFGPNPNFKNGKNCLLKTDHMPKPKKYLNHNDDWAQRWESSLID